MAAVSYWLSRCQNIRHRLVQARTNTAWAANNDRRSQVRRRLAAGGRWIRTIGTAYETNLLATPFGLRNFAFRNKNPALSCQGPMVRIHFPPPASHVRT